MIDRKPLKVVLARDGRVSLQSSTNRFKRVAIGEWLTVECPMYGVSCFAKDIPTLYADIVDQLEVNFSELVFTKDPLTRDAIEVQSNLKALLHECLTEFVSQRCEE